MKIASPWPLYPHTRFTYDGVTGTCTSGQFIEIPGDPEEVFIQPVAKGKGNALALGLGRIWSKKWGMLDVKDHMTKLKIEEEDAKRQAEMEAKPKPKAPRKPEPEGPDMDEWVEKANKKPTK